MVPTSKITFPRSVVVVMFSKHDSLNLRWDYLLDQGKGLRFSVTALPGRPRYCTSRACAIPLCSKQQPLLTDDPWFLLAFLRACTGVPGEAQELLIGFPPKAVSGRDAEQCSVLGGERCKLDPGLESAWSQTLNLIERNLLSN